MEIKIGLKNFMVYVRNTSCIASSSADAAEAAEEAEEADAADVRSRQSA